MNRTIPTALLSVVTLLAFGAVSADAAGPDPRLVRILKQGPVGVEQFNRWRRLNPIDDVNLRGADLRGANLRGADLRLADLSHAKLQGAVFGLSLAGELAKAKACRKSFEARKRPVDRYDVDAVVQNLLLSMSSMDVCENGFLIRARVKRSGANLRGADLRGAELDGADFTGAKGCGDVRNAPADFQARCANP